MTGFETEHRANASAREAHGFTLIELMITVAIVGILATIAYPSYVAYIIRANRADAQSQLLNATSKAERWYATHDSYEGLMLSDAEKQSPASGTPIYRIAIESADASGYVLRARPESTSVNKSDGFLQIDNQGVRSWDRNNNKQIDTGEDTWKKP